MNIINHLIHPFTINGNPKRYLTDNQQELSILSGAALYAILAFGLVFAGRPQLLGFQFNGSIGIIGFYVTAAFFKWKSNPKQNKMELDSV